MKPIIDPALFYWIDVLGKLGFLFGFIGVLVLLLVAGYVIHVISEYDKFTKKGVIFIVSMMIASVTMFTIPVFIPSEKTIYKMIIAKNVTPDNIEVVKGELSDLVDYIIEKIDELGSK